LLVIAAAAATAACSAADRATAPVVRPDEAGATERTLLYCPTSASKMAIATIGPAGGSIGIGDVRLTLPPGAVLTTTTFVVSAPASNHLEVEIHALGRSSFQFVVPATIAISYRRCGDVDGPLRAWYIDDETKALLENMGGVTDAVSRTHTFLTGHLSGYAVAN
jgi:hypothetical protein